MSRALLPPENGQSDIEGGDSDDPENITLSHLSINQHCDSDSSIPPSLTSSMEDLLEHINDEVSFNAELNNIRNEEDSIHQNEEDNIHQSKEERSVLQNIQIHAGTSALPSENKIQNESIEPSPMIIEVLPDSEKNNSKISTEVTKFSRSKIQKRK